jgi:hypothetical protein
MALRAPKTSKPPAKPLASSFPPARGGLLQRECACGGAPGLDDKCDECRQTDMGLQRLSAAPAGSNVAPPIVHDVLRSPGQPLDPAARASLEPRFGQDFSRVRIHADAQEQAPMLQGTIGNEATLQLRANSPATRPCKRPNGRRCQTGRLVRLEILARFRCSRLSGLADRKQASYPLPGIIQPKLAVGAVNDPARTRG